MLCWDLAVGEHGETRDAATLTQQDSITRTTLHYAANNAAFTRVLYCNEFLSYINCVLWVGPSLVTSRRKKTIFTGLVDIKSGPIGLPV